MFKFRIGDLVNRAYPLNPGHGRITGQVVGFHRSPGGCWRYGVRWDSGEVDPRTGDIVPALRVIRYRADDLTAVSG
jgi:hypothetical protein